MAVLPVLPRGVGCLRNGTRVKTESPAGRSADKLNHRGCRANYPKGEGLTCLPTGILTGLRYEITLQNQASCRSEESPPPGRFTRSFIICLLNSKASEAGGACAQRVSLPAGPSWARLQTQLERGPQRVALFPASPHNPHSPPRCTHPAPPSDTGTPFPTRCVPLTPLGQARGSRNQIQDGDSLGLAWAKTPALWPEGLVPGPWQERSPGETERGRDRERERWETAPPTPPSSNLPPGRRLLKPFPAP